MIYVTVVVIKADEKYNDECKDNDDDNDDVSPP
jgi:hypothetical protein